MTCLRGASFALIFSGLTACGPVASDQMGTDAARPVPEASDGGRANLSSSDAGSTTMGTGGLAPPDDDSPTFVPFQRDFQGFSTWPRFVIQNKGPVADGAVHAAGERMVYINQLPGPGHAQFPNKTIIVKTMENGDTFAVVKRGGAYNKTGARGWEWFELKRVDGEWLIVWRGITPPAGERYSGIAGGTCNDCHAAFAANDFIGTPGLSLSLFR